MLLKCDILNFNGIYKFILDLMLLMVYSTYISMLLVVFSRGVVNRGIGMHYVERGLIPGFSPRNVVFNGTVTTL